MVDVKFSIWNDNTNEIVRKVWQDDTNYCIIENDNNDKRCFIFFSSHGVFCPNTKEAFTNTIIKKNRFEWMGVTKKNNFNKKVGKIIFLRDVFKQWYITGINKKINNIDAIYDFLKSETKGYDVYTVGNSAGGYAATLLGIKLNAKSIYSFSGQFRIDDQLSWAPFLKKYNNDTNRNKYFNLEKYLKKSNSNIFYFYPDKASYDVSQASIIKDNYKNIFTFSFNQENHGTTVFSGNYVYLFNLPTDKLIKISQKNKDHSINKWKFLLETAGIKSLYEIMYRCYYKIKKKCFKSSNRPKTI